MRLSGEREEFHNGQRTAEEKLFLKKRNGCLQINYRMVTASVKIANVLDSWFFEQPVKRAFKMVQTMRRLEKGRLNYNKLGLVSL